MKTTIPALPYEYTGNLNSSLEPRLEIIRSLRPTSKSAIIIGLNKKGEIEKIARCEFDYKLKSGKRLTIEDFVGNTIVQEYEKDETEIASENLARVNSDDKGLIKTNIEDFYSSIGYCFESYARLILGEK